MSDLAAHAEALMTLADVQPGKRWRDWDAGFKSVLGESSQLFPFFRTSLLRQARSLNAAIGQPLFDVPTGDGAVNLLVSTYDFEKRGAAKLEARPFIGFGLGRLQSDCVSL